MICKDQVEFFVSWTREDETWEKRSGLSDGTFPSKLHGISAVEGNDLIFDSSFYFAFLKLLRSYWTFFTVRVSAIRVSLINAPENDGRYSVAFALSHLRPSRGTTPCLSSQDLLLDFHPVESSTLSVFSPMTTTIRWQGDPKMHLNDDPIR